MMTKMTHTLRMDFANAIRDRYAAAVNKDKRRILEEFIAATGYHERSEIRVLNSLPEPKGRQTRQRPLLFDEAARGALIVLWEASDRVCGKRLKALLPILLPALERNRHDKPRGRRPDFFKNHWEEMAACLEERPDQTALELLVEFRARYPEQYSLRQLHTLQRRVRVWRQEAVQRLLGEANSPAPYIAPDPSCRASG